MGCVTDIMQEVIFDVSETKTEFTSATTVTLKTMSMRTDSYPIFCADHRFFYHIYDKTTMVPIVSGIFDKN
jgi:serine protease inhibitor